jgi:UTP:GlnB (protein PII) uridylyltransferase
VDAGTISPLNVKETRGGLRDMEILLMILMARAGMWHPVTQELYVPLLERMPEQESELERIFSAFAYLKRRRDLYRLTVAAEDELIPNDMDYMAYVLGYCSQPGCGSGKEQLVEEIRATTDEISDIVTGMLDRMGL